VTGRTSGGVLTGRAGSEHDHVIGVHTATVSPVAVA
jgi:hypothetical protein